MGTWGDGIYDDDGALDRPKFGTATLISRTGAGPFEQLLLRFDSGETLKVLARFVVPIAT